MRTHIRWLLIMAAGLLLPMSCNKDHFFGDDFTIDDQVGIRAPGEETTGNNLSFPVIWASGSIAVRLGGPTFEGVTDFSSSEFGQTPGIEVWLQKDEDNEWKASTYTSTVAVEPNLLDWGDNLEARGWLTNSKVRVEVVLFENPLDKSETEYVPGYADDGVTKHKGYTMYHVSGAGISEVWGTSQETYDETSEYLATVYSNQARLIIQKVTPGIDNEIPAGMVWNPDLMRWTLGGEVVNEGYLRDVGFSAEVNVKGRVIYGYNWSENRTEGWYRLTFAFNDGKVTTDMTATTVVPFSETDTEETAEEDDDGGSPPNVPRDAEMEANGFASFIDLPITKRTSGGKGGNGGGNPNGGSKPENPGKGGGKGGPGGDSGGGGGNGPGGPGGPG